MKPVFDQNLILKVMVLIGTVFENHSKCRIWVVHVWHFPSNFVPFKLTWLACLVTLFDRKLQVFKNRQNWLFFDKLLSTQNVNVARFARNVECDLFLWFSNTVYWVASSLSVLWELNKRLFRKLSGVAR